jgi:hypothetical protein
MAQNGYVYQQVMNVSIPKDGLKEFIIMNDNLSKKDLRVCLMLFTELNGWVDTNRKRDPENFKKIDPEEIADALGYSTSVVKDSLKTLRHEGIIEKGNNQSMKNGYRFRF